MTRMDRQVVIPVILKECNNKTFIEYIGKKGNLYIVDKAFFRVDEGEALETTEILEAVRVEYTVKIKTKNTDYVFDIITDL
jgi:hypothetical protein